MGWSQPLALLRDLERNPHSRAQRGKATLSMIAPHLSPHDFQPLSSWCPWYCAYSAYISISPGRAATTKVKPRETIRLPSRNAGDAVVPSPAPLRSRSESLSESLGVALVGETACTRIENRVNIGRARKWGLMANDWADVQTGSGGLHLRVNSTPDVKIRAQRAS
mgnify:CR=1 FL=1